MDSLHSPRGRPLLVPRRESKWTCRAKALVLMLSPQRILTDAYLYDDEILLNINLFIRQMEETLHGKSITLAPDVETVLELFDYPDSTVGCGYYFVDHKSRCLFWHEDFQIDYLLLEVHGATCPSHISMFSCLWSRAVRSLLYVLVLRIRDRISVLGPLGVLPKCPSFITINHRRYQRYSSIHCHW